MRPRSGRGTLDVPAEGKAALAPLLASGRPVVGVSFCAYQGQLVVGNKYATAMVEENMDAGGFENNIAGCSCVTKEVAARAIQMLKNKMAGVAILPPEKKWNNAIINANNRLLGLSETALVESGTLH